MNPNEMSLEECRAWLLERDGWKHHPADTELRECWERGLARVFRNPMPLSLDAIDAARPEGPWRIEVSRVDDGSWEANAWRSDWESAEGACANVLATHDPDRLTCEARLCVAMWLAEGKA